MSTVVIYKTGLSETYAENKPGKVPSMGDVLRTTPILEALTLKYENIFWITSNESLGLLEGIEAIDGVFTEANDLQEILQDVTLFINLEKALPSSIKLPKAIRLVGFDLYDPTVVHTIHASYAFKHIREKLIEKSRTTIQDFVFYLIGKEFQGEPYRLPQKFLTKASTTSDVGLNWKVGSKWPTKIIEPSIWNSLDSRLQQKSISTSWQQGFNDIGEYIHWISGTKIIVTNDSLGLHIAMALKKHAICFFGPTDMRDIYDYKLITPYFFKTPSSYDCLPCYSNKCHMPVKCTEFLEIEEIIEKVERALNYYE